LASIFLSFKLIFLSCLQENFLLNQESIKQ
jgi:hypothetical protein